MFPILTALCLNCEPPFAFFERADRCFRSKFKKSDDSALLWPFVGERVSHFIMFPVESVRNKRPWTNARIAQQEQQKGCHVGALNWVLTGHQKWVRTPPFVLFSAYETT
jgi:hypothetical protein